MIYRDAEESRRRRILLIIYYIFIIIIISVLIIYIVLLFILIYYIYIGRLFILLLQLLGSKWIYVDIFYKTFMHKLVYKGLEYKYCVNHLESHGRVSCFYPKKKPRQASFCRLCILGELSMHFR